MDRTTLRFELVKLTFTHAKPITECTGAAGELEKFILEPEQNAPVQEDPSAATEAKATKSSKKSKADNSIFR